MTNPQSNNNQPSASSGKKIKLTREYMIEKIKADDVWLNRAVLTLLEWHEKNNKFLSLSHAQSLEYYRKWITLPILGDVLGEKKPLTGRHRNKAVAIVTEHRNMTVLFAIAVDKANGSKRSVDDKAKVDAMQKSMIDILKFMKTVSSKNSSIPPAKP